MIESLLQDICSGLGGGLVYGLIGVSFVVTYRITGMINFAQGFVVAASAFIAVELADLMPSLPAAMLAGVVGGGIVGLLVYLVAVHMLRNEDPLVQIIATLGAAMVIEAVLVIRYGSIPLTFEPFPGGGNAVRLGGVVVAGQVLWIAGITLVIYLLLRILFDRTMIGRAMSACAINRYAAGIVGINYVAMAATAFVISGAVSGVAGAAQVPIYFATPSNGFNLVLYGFIACVLGGFERIGVTLVGGMLVGTMQQFIAGRVSSTYTTAILFGFLLALLIVRPSGLTRLQVSTRV